MQLCFAKERKRKTSINERERKAVHSTWNDRMTCCTITQSEEDKNVGKGESKYDRQVVIGILSGLYKRDLTSGLLGKVEPMVVLR